MVYYYDMIDIDMWRGCSLELADGAGGNQQVQEALAMHDQSSHPLLSQMTTMGEEGRNPRGRRTRRITDPNNLIKCGQHQQRAHHDLHFDDNALPDNPSGASNAMMGSFPLRNAHVAAWTCLFVCWH